MEASRTRTADPVRELTGQQRAVLRTLLYFDVFGHPLRSQEIKRYRSSGTTFNGDLASTLEELNATGLIEQHEGFFGFGDLPKAIDRRRRENERARRTMGKARRMSRLIGRFPYVRGVMLSGSLSKGCLAADGDIDYFVITEPGRLWIARTLLIAFKKIFLLNSRRYFCVNYFVDLDHLAIEDRNQFTATEVLTLVPTLNAPVCDAFFRANAWASTFLPQAPIPADKEIPAGRSLVKRILERLMNGGLGDEIDEWCMHRTMRHWRDKFPELDRAQHDLALRSRRYVSKHHPRNFQERVLEAYAERIRGFERRTGTDLA